MGINGGDRALLCNSCQTRSLTYIISLIYIKLLLRQYYSHFIGEKTQGSEKLTCHRSYNKLGHLGNMYYNPRVSTYLLVFLYLSICGCITGKHEFILISGL